MNGRTPVQAFVDGIRKSTPAKEEKTTTRKPAQKQAAQAAPQEWHCQAITLSVQSDLAWDLQRAIQPPPIH